MKHYFPLLACILFLLLGSEVKAQQYKARFGISIECKNIFVTDSNNGFSFYKRIDFGDGSYADNAPSGISNYPRPNFLGQNTSHHYLKNGTYNVKCSIRYYNASQGIYISDSFTRQIQINCDSCSLFTNFSIVGTTADCPVRFFGSSLLGSPYRNQWFFGDGFTSLLDTTPYRFRYNGIFRVKLISMYFDTALGKYCVDSAKIALGISCQGMSVEQNALNQKTIQLYPNPSRSECTISSKSDLDESFVITNTEGKMLYYGILHSFEELKIETGDWASGLYIFKPQFSAPLLFLKE